MRSLITLFKILWVKILYTRTIKISGIWIINDGVRYEGCSECSGWYLCIPVLFRLWFKIFFEVMVYLLHEDTMFWSLDPVVFHCKGPYTLSVKLSDFYCMTSYLTEKLSKPRSLDRQWRRPQNCPFQSSFTQRTAQFTQGIPQFPHWLANSKRQPCFYPT